jgi:hypothetical protein
MTMRTAIQAAHSVPIQHTEKGLAYMRWRKALDRKLRSASPKDLQKWKEANLEFIAGAMRAKGFDVHQFATKGVLPSDVHEDAILTSLSTQYANDEFIGERLMPVAPVTKKSDKYYTYNKRDRFAFPDDKIGYRSSPNELNEGRGTDNYSVEDFGYMNFLDLDTVQQQDAPLNEMVDVVEAINEGMALRRELRLAAILNAAGSFGSNTAAATTAWDTAVSGGSIIEDCLAADAALWTGPNPTLKIAFTNLDVWNSGITNNPAVRDLFKNVEAGLTRMDQFARFFGWDMLLVGRAREDTANEGQTATYGRVWGDGSTGDNFGLLRVAVRPTTRSLHFGTTFREAGDPVTSEWFDPKIGKRGGFYAKVATSEDHKVVSSDTGFLITNVLA